MFDTGSLSSLHLMVKIFYDPDNQIRTAHFSFRYLQKRTKITDHLIMVAHRIHRTKEFLFRGRSTSLLELHQSGAYS